LYYSFLAANVNHVGFTKFIMAVFLKVQYIATAKQELLLWQQ